MELIQCPHCKTHVVPSSDGECPSCRKLMDSPVEAVVKDESPWASELPEPEPELATVARFLNPVEASLAKNCLDEAGFESFLADAETVSVAWQLSNALGGIKLLVAEPKAAQARIVLREQLDGSAGEQQGLIQEAIASRTLPVEGAEELPPEDDGADALESEPTEREEDAERAFRGAVLGLLFFPLQFYASYLLLTVLFSPEPLAGKARGRAFLAAAINVPYMLIVLVFGTALMRIL